MTVITVMSVLLHLLLAIYMGITGVLLFLQHNKIKELTIDKEKLVEFIKGKNNG